MNLDRVLWIEFRSYLHVELERAVWIKCIYKIPRILRARREDMIPVLTAYNKCYVIHSIIIM